MGHNCGEQDSFRGQNAMNIKPMRIDVPHFEGGDPQGWIFKIQQYFDFHNAIEEQRLQIAPLYFDGKASMVSMVSKEHLDCFLGVFLAIFTNSDWTIRIERLSRQNFKVNLGRNCLGLAGGNY